MNKFPDWITRKFVEWQAAEGKRKTIEEFAAYLGTSRPLVNMWMNGNKKPGRENINILAELFGNEIFDVLELPRRRVASVYLLSSIGKCARCGGSLNGQTTKQPYGDDYRQYICATAKNKKTCTAKALPAKVLEQLILDGLHKFFDDPHNLINVLTKFQALHSNRQDHVDEERASLSPQLATVRKKLNRLTDVLTEKPSSQALLKKLTALEAEESALTSKLAQLTNHTAAPIIVPTLAQSRARSQRIQQDLKSNDPTKVRQTLLGIIATVKADRIGKHILAKVDYYHIATVKKKSHEVNYVYITAPRGGTIYRHSLSFAGTIPPSGRPKKKPVS